ncbi:hypothetical protein LCGC14_2715900 [marine sediment metagenome]|uniref:Restriction endonuclease n=1 Tax=marine sediment metagenome TaxID=412755 RepID=A0A0F9C394_9ZZZZ
MKSTVGFKMKKINKIIEVFEKLESIIDDAYNSKLPDDILIRAYFTIIELLQDYTGTGRGVTGFSEFFYVRYIKKYLENKLGVRFEERNVERRNSKTFSAEYNGKKLILSSDKAVKEAGIYIRPDVFIGIQKEKGVIHPLAIFEIKLHQEEKDIEIIIRRFSDLRDKIKNKFTGMKDNDLPYFIWLYLRYEKYLNQNYEDKIKQFQAIENNFTVINYITEWYKSNIEPREGGINIILQKIIQKINDFSLKK